jgi:hypothetical protein
LYKLVQNQYRATLDKARMTPFLGEGAGVFLSREKTILQTMDIILDPSAELAFFKTGIMTSVHCQLNLHTLTRKEWGGTI